MKMNDLGSDFSKSYLIYIEECLGTFYSKHPSGPHLPLCSGAKAHMIIITVHIEKSQTTVLPDVGLLLDQIYC